MNCPQCGKEVRPGQAFCGQCGATLQMAAGQTPPMTAHRAASPSMAGMPALTTNMSDFLRLGALAILLISLLVPVASISGDLSFSVIRFGFVGWLAVLVVLVLAALTAIPAWRPGFWPSLERFLSATFVGSTVTVFILFIGVASVLGRFVSKLNELNQMASSFGGGMGGTTTSMGVHMGFGLILALIGSIGWAIVTRRTA